MLVGNVVIGRRDEPLRFICESQYESSHVCYNLKYFINVD